jgi:DNA-binding transcriptional LysR family regulator
MDRIGSLELFARVAEIGNFTAVGRERGISQSSVSRKISELEAWLGVQLFLRTTRQVRMTDAGAELYERCTGLLSEFQDIESSIGNLARNPSGNLRINAPSEFGRQHVVPYVMDFLADHPEISIDLDLQDRHVDMIEEGVDLAIRIGNLRDQSNVAKKLGRDFRHLVAAPAYLEEHGTPNSPHDLIQHQCIIYTNRTTPERWQFGGQNGAEDVTVSGRVRANSGEVMRAAVLKGNGIAILGHYAVKDDIALGRMSPLLLDYPIEPLNIQIVYAPTRHLPMKARAFIDYFAACLKRTGLFDA